MRNIVFDLDDTLWNLNKKASELTGIDYNKLKTFIAKENPLLTEDEKSRLLNLYSSPVLWEHIEWLDGAKDIYKLEQIADDIKVYLVSNCMTQEVIDYKRTFLSKELHIPDDQIILNLSVTSKKKKVMDDIYIFIDDSPYNVKDSVAKYTIIPDKPWNQDIINENTILYRINDLSVIINTIKSLI